MPELSDSDASQELIENLGSVRGPLADMLFELLRWPVVVGIVQMIV